jgi:S-adenosylmethionine decarboxylase
MGNYGKECIIDVHDCRIIFTRESIKEFCSRFCELLKMQSEDLVFWDYEGHPEEYAAAPKHLKGISAVQFIKTSNITLHSLDEMKRLYLNIFSCKDYNAEEAKDFVQKWTDGNIVQFTVLERV